MLKGCVFAITIDEILITFCYMYVLSMIGKFRIRSCVTAHLSVQKRMLVHKNLRMISLMERERERERERGRDLM